MSICLTDPQVELVVTLPAYTLTHARYDLSKYHVFLQQVLQTFQ